MREIIRILEVRNNQQRNGVFRFKIGYIRTIYPNYNPTNGDDIDIEIFNFFEQMYPNQVRWDFYNYNTENIRPSIITRLTGFLPIIIRLHIAPNISLVDLEKVRDLGITFDILVREITLFHRLSPEDENWPLLPNRIDISINHNVYRNITPTISPLILMP